MNMRVFAWMISFLCVAMVRCQFCNKDDKGDKESGFSLHGVSWRYHFDSTDSQLSIKHENVFPPENLHYDPERLGNVLFCTDSCISEFKIHKQFENNVIGKDTSAGYALSFWYKFHKSHTSTVFALLKIVKEKLGVNYGLSIVYERLHKRWRIRKFYRSKDNEGVMDAHYVTIERPNDWQHLAVRNDINRQFHVYQNGQRTATQNSTHVVTEKIQVEEFLLPITGLRVSFDNFVAWYDHHSEKILLDHYNNDIVVKAAKKELEEIISSS